MVGSSRGGGRPYFSNSSWNSSPGDGLRAMKETMGVSLRPYYSVPEVCFQERKRYSSTSSDILMCDLNFKDGAH